MPANPYTTKYATLSTIQGSVSIAFSQAETELSANGCPATKFLEIKYDSGQIQRVYDSIQVSTLPQREQLRLFLQLDGLFKKAVETALYP